MVGIRANGPPRLSRAPSLTSDLWRWDLRERPHDEAASAVRMQTGSPATECAVEATARALAKLDARLLALAAAFVLIVVRIGSVARAFGVSASVRFAT